MPPTATLDRPSSPLNAAVRDGKAAPARAPCKCATCCVSTLCLPGGLSSDDLQPLESLALTTRRVRGGETVFQDGDPFRYLYALRSGTCKATVARPNGGEQVTGFHMAGEVLGLDGLACDVHGTTVTALEDSEICLIPYRRLVAATAATPGAKDLMSHLMGQELLRDQSMMVMLSLTEAASRLAAFLLNLSERHASRGYSPREFWLRMSRAEIASFLGLTLETVSRTLKSFQRRGFLRVDGRHVTITDIDGLRASYDLRIR
ncbi:helix-turn-helix domain-containing protein [Ramlibacter sp.]|uniref:helix-turn-helix domain-containing protein n=1 Tax=Ramlibacter sp. TaxID=1917967 RepID=UPI002C6ADEE1|nr:helix-turn-helix domain-containing protein [Ramlibacter sp.]HWI82628.1 helix-turn-helix domain-containing protein [Ramlibacter sp.]